MPSPSPFGCAIPGSTGNVSIWGNPAAKVLFVGEAAGKFEAIKGQPFVGDAGTQLDRLLRFIGRDRNEFRIVNTKLCHPPNDWLVGAPWEHSPCGPCDFQLESALNSGHKVVVTLGGTALRRVMKFPAKRGKEGGQLNDFHGAPIRDPGDRFWVVPTYHPSFLLRGAQKLTKTVTFDLRTALELADGKWEFDLPELVIDPPIDWFERWATEYEAVSQEVWLDFDVETPDKSRKSDEGELAEEDASYEILFINLSYRPDQGVTVPWAEPFITVVKKMLAMERVKVAHNRKYDIPRLKKAGCKIGGAVYDTMDMFHVLHPQLPRGLGFIAPFYSKTGPYKHLGNLNGTYRALDGVTGLRVAYGVAKDLQSWGMWHVYETACYKRDLYSLEPATAVGLNLNRAGLETEFMPMLEKALAEADEKLHAVVPEAAKPLDGPYVKKVEPKEGGDEEWTGEVVEKAEGEIRVCRTCGVEKVPAKHRCKGWRCGCGVIHRIKPTKRALCPCGAAPGVCQRMSPDVVATPVGSIRYYKKLRFNPDSWQQVLSYIKYRGHKPGRAKKTGKESTDKKALTRLIKTGDSFYPTLLGRRAASKMHGTYGTGMIRHIDSNSRIHGDFGHLPWTMRINSTAPNMTNLADHVRYAADFKRQIQAGPGCVLIEVDFSGIEAVKVGYFSGDPDYIRHAKRSIHGYVQSHLLFNDKKIPEAVNLKWSEADIKAHLKEIKNRFPDEYDKSKRCVHGYNYGLTEFGMSDYYPEVFPTRGAARKVIEIYTAVCSRLKGWQARICTAAHEKQFLGGPSPSRAESATARYHEMILGFFHPYGYRCEFYGVLNFRKDKKGEWQPHRGEDAKKAISYFPQSDSAGDLCAAELELFTPESENFIGDAYYGRTPLRAPIHDSLLLEVPEGKVDEVKERVVRVMSRPQMVHPQPEEWGMGPFLSVGVAMEMGKNWAPAHDEKPCKTGCDHRANPDGMRAVGVEDLAKPWRDEEEEEESA